MEPVIYIMPIAGTKALAIFAILLIPPTITNNNRTDKTEPVMIGFIENSESMTSAILLICGILPVPMAVNIIKNAKTIASHFMFIPCSI